MNSLCIQRGPVLGVYLSAFEFNSQDQEKQCEVTFGCLEISINTRRISYIVLVLVDRNRGMAMARKRCVCVEGVGA